MRLTPSRWSLAFWMALYGAGLLATSALGVWLSRMAA